MGNIRTIGQGKPRYWAWNQDIGSGMGSASVIILGISPVGKQGRKAITSNSAQGQSSSINTNWPWISVCLISELDMSYNTPSAYTKDWFQ